MVGDISTGRFLRAVSGLACAVGSVGRLGMEMGWDGRLGYGIYPLGFWLVVGGLWDEGWVGYSDGWGWVHVYLYSCFFACC